MREIPEEGIRLGGEPEAPDLGPGMDIPPKAMAFLSDPEMWKNWEDVELARAEEMLRDWIERMCEVPSWRSTRSKKRRYTFSMLFANALTAYATPYMMISTNYPLLPIKITSMFTGEMAQQQELGSALSITMMLIMLLVIFLCNLVKKIFYKGGNS